MTLELQTLPVISTCHLIGPDALKGHDATLIAEYWYGWFLYVGDPANWEHLDWFKPIAEWAHNNGHDWVRFDRDAEIVEELPTYDW